jgi:NAD-dependent aldehyde dehydrogenases
VVLPDADVELAASAVAAGGYINAGQVCISVQRVITHPAVAADFLDALVPKVEAIRTGDPGSPDTTMGTLITTDEAERVEETIRRAVDEGAKLLTGGGRDGAIVAPAVVAGVDPRSSFSQDELFGPAVAVSSAEDFQARSRRPTARPTGSARASSPPTYPVPSGPSGRSTPATCTSTGPRCGGPTSCPTAGLKASGIGKEGPRSAVAEMTDVKTVILHGRPW